MTSNIHRATPAHEKYKYLQSVTANHPGKQPTKSLRSTGKRIDRVSPRVHRNDLNFLPDFFDHHHFFGAPSQNTRTAV
jgi:hypothetical protein